MYMLDGDIITSFKQAKDQKKQIQVLADLNGCTRQQMVSKLKELGLVDENKAKKRDRPANSGRCINPEEEARRRALYDSGATDAELAEALGLSRKGVMSWRYSRGLTQHYRDDPKPPKKPKTPSVEPVAAPAPEEVPGKPEEVMKDVPIEEELREAAARPAEDAQDPRPMSASDLLPIIQRVAQGWPDAPVLIRGEGLLEYAHLSIVFGTEGKELDVKLVLHRA